MNSKLLLVLTPQLLPNIGIREVRTKNKGLDNIYLVYGKILSFGKKESRKSTLILIDCRVLDYRSKIVYNKEL
jgi:hypothetical protein